MKNSPEQIEDALTRAKAHAHEILASGIVFEYEHLRGILGNDAQAQRISEELERRHMVVNNVPPTAQVSAEISEEQPETEAEERDPTSDEASNSSGETFQCNLQVNWKNRQRQLMEEKGLYKKTLQGSSSAPKICLIPRKRQAPAKLQTKRGQCGEVPVLHGPTYSVSSGCK